MKKYLAKISLHVNQPNMKKTIWIDGKGSTFLSSSIFHSYELYDMELYTFEKFDPTCIDFKDDLLENIHSTVRLGLDTLVRMCDMSDGSDYTDIPNLDSQKNDTCSEYSDSIRKEPSSIKKSNVSDNKNERKDVDVFSSDEDTMVKGKNRRGRKDKDDMFSSDDDSMIPSQVDVFASTLTFNKVLLNKDENNVAICSVCKEEPKLFRGNDEHYICQSCNKFQNSNIYCLNKQSLSCKACSDTFKTYNQLKEHVLRYFNLNDLCDNSSESCTANFADAESSLQESNSKTNFSLYGNLNRNKTCREDTDVCKEKPQGFYCTVCNKLFKQRGSLKTHQLIHENKRSFVCHVCNRGFIRKDYLQKHMYTHSPKKPFQCFYCEKQFSQKHHLKTHERSHHEEQKEGIEKTKEGEIKVEQESEFPIMVDYGIA